MKTRKISFVITFLAGATTFLSARSCSAIEETLSPAPRAETMSGAEWATDPLLKHKIALEIVRKPLAETIEELGAQAAVTLKVDPSLLKGGRQVTMRLNGLPLVEVLACLCDLYGGTWRKSGAKEFAWLPLEQPFEIEARRLGGTDGPLTRAEYEAQGQQSALIANQVFASLDQNQWRSPEPVLFQDFPLDAQELLIKYKQAGNAEKVARAYTFYQKIMASNPFLHLGEPPKDSTSLWTADIYGNVSTRSGIGLMFSEDHYAFPLFTPQATQPGSSGDETEAINRATQQKADRLRDRIRNPNRR